MMLSTTIKGFSKSLHLACLAAILPGCAGTQAMTTPSVLAENSIAATQAQGDASTVDTERQRSRRLPPAQVSLPSATTADTTKCLDGVQYTKSFDDTFAAFPAVSGLSGAWQTQYMWGRENPGALDDAYYADANVVKAGPHKLELTASRTPASLLASAHSHPYLGGAINSSALFSQTYGYFEATIKMPVGKGIWPAFWLLPIVGYPPEIDIMEALGDDPTHVYETTHSTAYQVEQTQTVVPSGVSGLHTYAVAWTHASVSYYIDGVKVSTERNISNQAMYMVLNIAVGKSESWPGAPGPQTIFPATMEVQGVRAFALTPNHC